MRTLKTFTILGLAVLLLGFMISCKKVKNPYSPNIPKIIDDNDNNEEDDPLSEENYPSEITGDYYGTPLTLTGNTFEVTLESVEFKETIQGISGNIWRTTDYGFVIYRYKIKNLLEKSPHDPGEGAPFPIWAGWLGYYSGSCFHPEKDSGFINDCFPGERYGKSILSIYPQEVASFVSAVQFPEYALTDSLAIGFTQNQFCDKTQEFRFQLQFTIQDII